MSVPALRFPEFSGEWEPSNLKNITRIYDGTHQTPNYVTEGVPFYSVEHVTANQFERTKFISEEVYEKENKRVKLERDDILMTRIGDIGTARLVDWDVRASFYVSLALIKSNPSKFESGFLSSYLGSDYLSRELHRRTIHVAFPKKINLGEIGETDLALPTLREQKKISAFLGAVDAKIAALRARRAGLERYKRGLMQALFSQTLRFTKPDGSAFPDWEEKRLGEVTNCLDSKRKPLNTSERQSMQGEYPYYGANGQVDSISDFLFDEDLVLLAEDGGNFDEFTTRPIAQRITGKCWVNNHAHILTAKKGNVTHAFLFYSLVHKDIRKYINGSSRAKLNKSDMLTIRMMVPHPGEQAKIAAALSAMDSKIAAVGDQVTKMEAFKKGLLQQMFV